jgi:predicted transcriptional regulator with HTH domain
VRADLYVQIKHLCTTENELLYEDYQKVQISEQALKTDMRGLTESVNKRSKLEESVIIMGLSNNYFKNVSKIFKIEIST